MVWSEIFERPCLTLESSVEMCFHFPVRCVDVAYAMLLYVVSTNVRGLVVALGVILTVPFFFILY